MEMSLWHGETGRMEIRWWHGERGIVEISCRKYDKRPESHTAHIYGSRGAVK